MYWTLEASVFPPPSFRVASLTSTARLNRRTADPFFGGTKLAAIVSTDVALVGGQRSLHTTTNGPGVSGILVVSSVLPDAWSFNVIVPAPPATNVIVNIVFA